MELTERPTSAGFHGLTIRGDASSCPLAFGLDTYYNCPFDCVYCKFLGLAATWGKDFRALDVAWFQQQMARTSGKTPLAGAIRTRKTLRIGNKYDPLPPAETSCRVTQRVLETLARLKWQVKLESKNTDLMLEYADLLIRMGAIVSTTVMIGLDDDWATFEGKRPPSPMDRLAALARFALAGLQVAVITEPFIPGHHTTAQWRDFCLLLRGLGITRLNLYNLQWSPFVAKRLADRTALDLERVYDLSAEGPWRKQLRECLAVGDELGMTVGCPDWVNAGRWMPRSNTCCAVDVDRPCTFNWVNWRRIGLERGRLTSLDVVNTWDNVGDLSAGLLAFNGHDPDHFSIRDTGEFTWDEGEQAWRRN